MNVHDWKTARPIDPMESAEPLILSATFVNEHRRDLVVSPISRTGILGVGVSLVTMKEAVRQSEALICTNGCGYICATDVHTLIEAQADPELLAALNRSFLTTPDGMPLVWVAKMQGHRRIERVYGPDYMLEMCRASVQRKFRHFLYGGNLGVAEKLKTQLLLQFPGIEIVGTYTPPFRPLTATEELELKVLVASSKPDILWVGLGSPKQELFMASHCGKMDVKLMVGVGAAFDFHSGAVKEAPFWVKHSGFQWLYRLMKEPKRLWRRYLNCVPKFLINIALQLTGLRRFGNGT